MKSESLSKNMNQRKYSQYPLPSVSAIVIGEKGILLIKRNKEPNKGLWSIPGGVVEIGETQKEAIVREITEETGIRPEIIEFLNTGDIILRDSEGRIEYQYMINRYFAYALTTDIQPGIDEADASWFKLDNLPTEEMPQNLLELIEYAKIRMKKLGLE